MNHIAAAALATTLLAVAPTLLGLIMRDQISSGPDRDDARL